MASMRFIIHLLLYTTALSLPIDHQQVLRNVECHRVDVYTPDWFLRNTLPGYRREIHGRALFYTKGASKYAQRLACKSTDYVSIWQICTCTHGFGRTWQALTHDSQGHRGYTMTKILPKIRYGAFTVIMK